MASSAHRLRDADRTRRLLVERARVLFERSGYRATTVKAVADATGVSPNLVTRYFGGKAGLFLAASAPRINEGDVFTGDLAGLGERLARSVATRWSAPPGADPLLMLQRAAGDHPEAAATLSDFLDRHSRGPLEQYLRDQGLPPAAAADRAAAVDVLILGLSTRRRVLRQDLVVDAAFEDWLATSIQDLVEPSTRPARRAGRG